MDKESPLELGTYRQKESVGDMRLETELNDNQSRLLQALLKSHDKVFFDVPRKKFKIEHKTKLMDEEPVRSKPYPMQYALRQICVTSGYCQEEGWFKLHLRRFQEVEYIDNVGSGFNENFG